MSSSLSSSLMENIRALKKEIDRWTTLSEKIIGKFRDEIDEFEVKCTGIINQDKHKGLVDELNEETIIKLNECRRINGELERGI